MFRWFFEFSYVQAVRPLQTKESPPVLSAKLGALPDPPAQ